MIKILFAAYLILCALFLLLLLKDKKRLQYLGIFFLFACSFPVVYLTTVIAARDTILITEICSNNFSVASNSADKYTDYIEIYNTSDSAVSLLGWTLYTENELAEYYEFGNIILQPDSGLLLFYNPDSVNAMDPVPSITVPSGSFDILEIPCAVSRDGETLYLCNSAGKTADAVDVPALKYDTVYARGADMNWGFYTPTPGTGNAAATAIHPESSYEIPDAPAYAAETLLVPYEEYTDFYVLSLSVAKEDLYGTDGIFLTENLTLNGRTAERECQIDLYSPGLNYEFSQKAGIRVSGRTDNLSHFDFNLYARDIYETRTLFEFDFLDEDLFLNKLHLKYNATQEHLLLQLLANSNISSVASIPCVLFLNGEFYGEYYLMQPPEEEFIAETNEIALEDLTLLEDGDLAFGIDYFLYEYRNLIKNAVSADLSIRKNYDYLCSKVDMESLVTYYAVQIFLNNYEFSPYDSSLVWRSSNTDFSNTAANGKWHYEITGLDSTLINTLYNYGTDTNTCDEILSKDELFEALLWNDDFYHLLYDRIRNLSENEFGEKQIAGLLSESVYFDRNSIDITADFQSFFQNRPQSILSDLEKTKDSLTETESN